MCNTCVRRRAAHHVDPELQVVVSCTMGCLEPKSSLLSTELPLQLQVLSLKVSLVKGFL